MKDIFKRFGILFILIVMVIILSLLSPAFLKVQNIINIIRQVSIVTILAFGVTNIIITTGIDLSSGSVVALVSVVVASLAHPNQYPLIVPIMAGLGVGILTICFSITPSSANTHMRLEEMNMLQSFPV